eukprot:scaffold66385_cov33-Phaeocystis_antarctica.AAC.1
MCKGGGHERHPARDRGDEHAGPPDLESSGSTALLLTRASLALGRNVVKLFEIYDEPKKMNSLDELTTNCSLLTTRQMMLVMELVTEPNPTPSLSPSPNQMMLVMEL